MKTKKKPTRLRVFTDKQRMDYLETLSYGVWKEGRHWFAQKDPWLRTEPAGKTARGALDAAMRQEVK